VAEWFKAPVLKVARPCRVRLCRVPFGADFQCFSPSLILPNAVPLQRVPWRLGPRLGPAPGSLLRGLRPLPLGVWPANGVLCTLPLRLPAGEHVEIDAMDRDGGALLAALSRKGHVAESDPIAIR
jgi:hypothetical protein